MTGAFIGEARRDWREACNFWRDAADMGNPEAMVQVAHACLTKLVGKQDDRRPL
jgi:TPR repeat protein